MQHRGDGLAIRGDLLHCSPSPSLSICVTSVLEAPLTTRLPYKSHDATPSYFFGLRSRRFRQAELLQVLASLRTLLAKGLLHTTHLRASRTRLANFKNSAPNREWTFQAQVMLEVAPEI